MTETFWLGYSDTHFRDRPQRPPFHLVHQATHFRRAASMCGIYVTVSKRTYNTAPDVRLCKKCLKAAQPFIGSPEREPGTPDQASQSQS